jgi:hypothetical protein
VNNDTRTVWMPPLIRLPAALCTVRSRPDTMPVVSVCYIAYARVRHMGRHKGASHARTSNPNGLPIANTV